MNPLILKILTFLVIELKILQKLKKKSERLFFGKKLHHHEMFKTKPIYKLVLKKYKQKLKKYDIFDKAQNYKKMKKSKFFKI